MKWIKAEERLPDGGDIIWRFIGITNVVGCCYKPAFGFMLSGFICYKEYEKIEWLDEFETPEEVKDFYEKRNKYLESTKKGIIFASGSNIY